MKRNTPEQEWEQLLKDYNEDNAYIQAQKFRWLDIKPEEKETKDNEERQD